MGAEAARRAQTLCRAKKGGDDKREGDGLGPAAPMRCAPVPSRCNGALHKKSPAPLKRLPGLTAVLMGAYIAV